MAGGDRWSNTGSNIIVYDITNDKLVELNSFTVPSNTFDFAVDTSKVSEQGIFVGTNVNDSSSYYNSNSVKLQKLDAHGKTIWRSPAMIGHGSKRGIKFKQNEDGSSNLLISTSSAMHMLKSQP